MSSRRPRIEGFAIISSEGMIAASDGSFPENLKIPADQKFYQDSVDRAAAVAGGDTRAPRLARPQVAAGMVAGIGGALIVPPLAKMMVGHDFNMLYTFPVIFIVSVIGCVAGTLLTQPEDVEVLKKFYRTVNPWGAWGPIRALVMAEDRDFKPNHSAVHDLTNVAVGIVWQLCLVTLPIYLVLRQWSWAGGIAVVLTESGASAQAARQQLGGHDKLLEGVLYSADGSTLASCAWDNKVRLWSVADNDPAWGSEIASLSHPCHVYAIALTPDGRFLATGSTQGLTIWENRGAAGWETAIDDRGIAHRSLAASPDSRSLAVGCSDGSIRFWDLETHRATTVLREFSDEVRSLCFSMASTSAAVSLAASSCRHRMTRSTAAMISRLACGSLRRAGSMLTTFTPAMPCSRSRICRPVVPASPSMKIRAMRAVLVRNGMCPGRQAQCPVHRN